MAIAVPITRTYQCMAVLGDGYPCGKVFTDASGQAPCPQCGNADDTTIVAVEAEAEEAPARGPQAKAAAYPVKSAGQAKSRPRGQGLVAYDRVPGWLLGTLLLMLWWAIGGKYTIEGLPLAANLIADWFHVPFHVAPITDGTWYLRLCWLPVLISFVERQYRPWQNRAILSRERFWLVLLWLVTIGLDAGSTWLAIRNPAPGAWTITQQVAALAPLAATWALLTTFGPESGLSWLWKWLRGA